MPLSVDSLVVTITKWRSRDWLAPPSSGATLRGSECVRRPRSGVELPLPPHAPYRMHATVTGPCNATGYEYLAVWRIDEFWTRRSDR